MVRGGGGEVTLPVGLLNPHLALLFSSSSSFFCVEGAMSASTDPAARHFLSGGETPPSHVTLRLTFHLAGVAGLRFRASSLRPFLGKAE